MNIPPGVDPALYLASAGKTGINDLWYSSNGHSGYPYGNEEEPTDEARTNDDAYDELQQ